MSSLLKIRPSRKLLRFYSVLMAGPIGVGSLHAADVIKANNTDALNTASSWASNVLPTENDVAVFDSSVTAGSNFGVGGNLALQGIRVQGNASGLTISGTGTQFLTLGKAGFDLSGATSGSFVDIDSPTIRLAPGSGAYWKAGAGVSSTIWGAIQGLTTSLGPGGTINFDYRGTNSGSFYAEGFGSPGSFLPYAFAITDSGMNFATPQTGDRKLVAADALGVANPSDGGVATTAAVLGGFPAAGSYTDVTVSNGLAASTAFAVNANIFPPAGGAGFRFNQPHTTAGTNWTISFGSNGRLQSSYPLSILVTPGVGARDVIFGNGSGAHEFRFNAATGQLGFHQFNTAGNLYWRGDVSTAAATGTTGATSILKTGPGKLIFANATFAAPSGTLVGISEGTVQLGENNATGSFGGLGIVNNGTLRIQRSDTVTFSNLISGSGNLEVALTATGNLTLSGASTYTGSTKLESGTVTLGSATPFGASSSLNLAGASLFYGTGITADISISPINLSANTSVNTNGNNVTWSGAIGGTANLTKIGAGALTLGGASTYTGNTNINAGELIVSNASGSATGTGAVTMAAGTTLRGTGTIGGAVTVNATTTVSPGVGTNGIGTLTTGAISLPANSNLAFDFSSTSSYDKVVTTSNNGLTINGGKVTLLNSSNGSAWATPGTYNLFQYSGSVQGTGPGALTVQNPQAGYSYTFGSTGSFVTLQIILDAILSNWTATGSGSWANGANWSAGVPTSGYTAKFTTPLASAATVTLDGDRSVNGMVFDSAAAGYTVAQGTGSGSLTLAKDSGPAAIDVLSGNHEISSPVVLSSTASITAAAGSSLTLSGAVSGSGGVTTLGAGLVSLTNHNSFSGAINVNSGLLGFSFADSLGSGVITLNGGGLRYNTGNTVDISSKTINFGANGGTIDTNGNDVVFANSLGNSGAGSFTKAGAGLLTLSADSTYLGDTWLAGGDTLIAGNGSLGPVATGATLHLNGGTLVPAVSMALDNAGANARAVVVESGGGGLMTASGVTLTINGAMSGSGVLTKQGPGTLTLTANNSTRTGASTIESGVVRLGNSVAIGQTGLGTGAITLKGTSEIYMNGQGVQDTGTSTDFGGLTNAIIVPEGASVAIRTPMRGRMSGAISGVLVTDLNNVSSYKSGNLDLYIDATRFDFGSSLTNFTGTLTVRKTPTGTGTETDQFRLNTAINMPSGKMHIASGVSVAQVFNPPNTSPFTTTHNIGQLTTDAGVVLGGNAVRGRFNEYSLGALNTDVTLPASFRGTGGNSFGVSYPRITKVGTGRLVLTADHMTSGSVNVNGGVLDVRGSIAAFYESGGADGIIGGSNGTDDYISFTAPTDGFLYQVAQPGAFTVAAAGTLAGNGTLGGAITVNGTLRPDSTGTLGGNLNLTGAASLTLAGTTQFDFNGANFTGVKSTSTGANTLGGGVVFNFLGTIYNGTYKVFDLAVTPTGTFSGVTATSSVTTTPVVLDGTSGSWVGTLDGASLSFNPVTGVLTVENSAAGSAITPGTSTLNATAGNAQVGLSWNSASGADTYTVKRATVAGGPYTNVISNLAGTSYSDTGVTNGTTYYYVVQAKNSSSGLSGVASNEVSATPTAVVYTGLQTWRFEQFGVYEDDNTVLAGDTEDYDGDGLVNLLEYALGTDPKVPNASPVVVGKSGNNLTLSYPRRSPADTSINYVVQGSSDLTGAFSTGAGSTNTVGSTSTYTDNVDVSVAGARRFLRLSVSYGTPAP